MKSLSFLEDDITNERLDEIEETHCPLRESEIRAGWHYCPQSGGELVGPYHLAEWDECMCPTKVKPKMKKIRFVWSCTDFVHHEHRFHWTARLCSIIQLLAGKILQLYPR
jgi:hypothetical protein